VCRGAGRNLRPGRAAEKRSAGRTLPVVLTITLCATLVPGANAREIRTPAGTSDIPEVLLDVETGIRSPRTIEVPGLVPITIRLTNLGDTAAFVPRVDVSIRPSGFSGYRESISVRAGRDEYVSLGPWVCPAGNEETCTAWITYPEDMNHHNDTDVVIVNSAWQRTYDGGHGSDEGRSVAWPYGPGFITAGWTRTSAGDIDVYLVKVNVQGDTLWTRTYGGTGYDAGNSVQQTHDYGYIISGTTTSFGAGDEDVFLIKTDSLGETLWTRVYGGTGADEGNSVEQTDDDGYIIAGWTESSGAGGRDVYLVKTNASGDTLWTRTCGDAYDNWGNSVQQVIGGGYVIAGVTGPGYGDACLIKTDSLGNTRWTRVYGGVTWDGGRSVQQTTDGGYVVCGYTTSFGAGHYDVYLVKTDSSGDTLWTRAYGGAADEEGHDVQQTTDGGYIVTGYSTSYDAGFGGDVYLVKTDSSGDTLWTRTYGGPGADVGYSVMQPIDGSYVIAGCTGSFGAGDSDVYLIKTWGLLDVGPTTILSPPRVAEFDSVYVPRVVLRNFGLTSGMLRVTMEIGSGYTQTVQETLASVPLDTLSFPPWTAGPAGPMPITCFTSLAGDQHPTNDTIRDSVRVLNVYDVAATAILSPPGVAESGRVYVPSAVVCNFGSGAATFPVTMDIGTVYTRTVQETLASGLCDTVVFPAWTADPEGPLEVTCFTSLAGDEDPANDTIHDSTQVVPPPHHDVGAVAIVSPSGNVRAGDSVMPQARIRNFGDTQERFFNVRFRIGADYSQTINVADALLPDSTVVLTFPPWPAEAGNWAVSCSTMLAGDADPSNDRAGSLVQGLPQTLAIEPDQSDRLEAGKGKTFRFRALIQGDTGGVVELALPSAPPGWGVRLCDATGANDMADTDGDGTPDLGYAAPGKSGWFSLEVAAPSGTQGDTASLAQGVFLVAGQVGNRSDIVDTARLTLTLVPELSIHNFPNPFTDHTTFVIGLPDDGKASLTVYTRAGERVCRVLADADLAAGVHIVPWSAVNDGGRHVAPGTYEYVLDYMHEGKTDRVHKKLVLTEP
jgi:hypothetical protein